MILRCEQLPSEVLAKVSSKVAKVEDYKAKHISYNKVYEGVILANGETVLNPALLQSLGVTAVLNAAERDVPASPTKLAAIGIQYHGFHVDDLPDADISRHFKVTTDFIHSVVSRKGLVVVNCYQGVSRSATCVLAYLMDKHRLPLAKVIMT